MNNISLGDLKELEVFMPSLDEQKQIADKLDILLTRVDACRERLERVPEILQRFRQSVLRLAVSGKLSEGWRNVNNTPSQWLSKPLSSVAQSRLGKMLDRSKNQGTPTKYLRNLNVRWLEFDLTDIQEIRVTEKESIILALEPGDLLVCEGGEPGRCAVWSNQSDHFVYQKALHRVRVGPEIIPEWLAYCLKDAADSGRLEHLFTGTTIKHLTGVSLAKFEVPIPSVQEQKEIVNRIHQLFCWIDRVNERYDSAIKHLDYLSSSILSRAFSGELAAQHSSGTAPDPDLISDIQQQKVTKLVGQRD